jgi:hypothetical protein
MTGDRPVGGPVGDSMDRYVRDELSPAEARELAQASLDSPELFADLTDSALAKAALYTGTLPTDKIVRFPRKACFVIGGLAAAVLLISLAIVRPWRASQPQGQPILLASGLQFTPTPVFRGAETDSRTMRTAGSIVSIADGVANIDLGSLDGLAKGNELPVFRDDRSTEAIGHLQVTTVFRDRARGRVLDGQVRAKDRVRVDDASHLDALLEQVDAFYNRGDADAAYRMAEQASPWVQTANLPPARQAVWWNQLAVLRMRRGDYVHAEEPLSRAVSASPQPGLPYARIVNNLGVLAELRGDRRVAESRYADAVQAFAAVADAPEQERRAAEANLARLRGSH